LSNNELKGICKRERNRICECVECRCRGFPHMLCKYLERKKRELSAWVVSASRASRLAPVDLAAYCPGSRSGSGSSAYLGKTGKSSFASFQSIVGRESICVDNSTILSAREVPVLEDSSKLDWLHAHGMACMELLSFTFPSSNAGLLERHPFLASRILWSSLSSSARLSKRHEHCLSLISPSPSLTSRPFLSLAACCDDIHSYDPIYRQRKAARNGRGTI
jgi:hypothetical protein